MNRQHMEQKDFPIFLWKCMGGFLWSIAQVCQKFNVSSRKLVTVLSKQIKISRLNRHCYYFLLDMYQRKAKDKNSLAHSSLTITSLLVPSFIRID